MGYVQKEIAEDHQRVRFECMSHRRPALLAGRKGIGKSADEYLESGQSKLDNGDFYGAIDDWNKAIDINPQYADAYVNRGYAKEKLGDHQGAIANYTKAIQIDPQDALAYIKRGYEKGLSGDLQGMCLDLRKGSSLGNKTPTKFLKKYCQ